MCIDRVLLAVTNVVTVGYCEWEADCPACRGVLYIRTNSDGQADVRCQNGCARSDVLHDLGLSHYDLLPDDPGAFRAYPSGGLCAQPPRYAIRRYAGRRSLNTKRGR